jgi:hypothetical protein
MLDLHVGMGAGDDGEDRIGGEQDLGLGHLADEGLDGRLA